MRKIKRGGKKMMPELVMQVGNSYIEKEEKKEKKKNIILFSVIRELIEIILLKKHLKKLDYTNIIQVDKEVLNGSPVIKGTRISPKIIYEHFIKNCEEKNFDIEKFVKFIKKEYPSLKKKNEKTIMKSLLYHIAHEPLIKIIKD